MSLTRFIRTSILLLLITIGTLGCAEKMPQPVPEQKPAPEITIAYLVKNRIISDAPKFRAKVVATLPFEVITFEESFLLNLAAQIPDTNTSSFKSDYYLRLERRGHDNWRDYKWIISPQLKEPTLQASFSSVRQGLFYEDYTVDLDYQDLKQVSDKDLQLTFINKQHQSAYLILPSKYVKAFIKIVDKHRLENRNLSK